MHWLLVLTLTFLQTWSPRAHAEVPLCFDLFRHHDSFTTSKKADKVFTTQSAIGRVYAEVKLLEKAQLSEYKSLTEVSAKDFKKLEKYISELMEDPLPAVLSPQGEVFIIDGHHDLYALVLTGQKLESVKVSLEIVKDYREEGFSEEQFHQDLIEREWADRDSVQKTPKLISELQDSPERSLAGLSFLAISQANHISLVGKHFVPRVQFKLIDLVKKENLFTFSAALDSAQVENFAHLILSEPKIIDFLIDALTPNASKKLRKFLLEKQQEARAILPSETLQK